MSHKPVMVEEVLHYLLHPDSRLVVDATVGGGGHARAALDAKRELRVIGVDRDPAALRAASRALAGYRSRVRLVLGSYADLAAPLGAEKVDGVLVDLGVSSFQLDTPGRGFSYAHAGPLDMRMSAEGTTAKSLIESSSEDRLCDILRGYGELAHAKRIARAIAAASRKDAMNSTADLRKVVESTLGRRATPAVLSKVFQAFRIAVNDELSNIRGFLGRVAHHLRDNARVVCVSYHSLEDRLIKDFFKRESTDCLCPPDLPACVCGHTAIFEVLTRRVVKPSTREVLANPRARSARLRAVCFRGEEQRS